MIAAARDSGERHAELQARNWRVTDLFELGDMPACREEVARHARLADELRLPTFQWYTPLWEAGEALLAGRFGEADCSRTRRGAGLRAGDGNAELFADMLLFTGQFQRGAFDEVDLEFIEDKIANSPAGPAYAAPTRGCSPGAGEPTGRARRSTTRSTTRTPSTPTGCPPRPNAPRPASSSATPPTPPFYERLLPYAGRPATAGRAVVSYGAVDRHLGGLAALLGRRDEAGATCAPRSPATTSSGAPYGPSTPNGRSSGSRHTTPHTASASETARALGLAAP